MDDLLESISPGVLKDPDYIELQQKIRAEDIAMCEAGVDGAGKKFICETCPEGATDCKFGAFNRLPKSKYQTSPRKLRQLKVLVLWLQNHQQFGKYCFYGCYCLPEGSENLLAGGYGEPVDMVDRSCKLFFQCYECAKLGNEYVAGDENCDGTQTKYKYILRRNKSTNERSIECTNKEGSCERKICECDKKMSVGLSQWEDEWNSNFHTKKNDGSWKYDEQCKKRGTGKYGRPETCCGTEFPDMIPKQEGKECCGHRPFDPLGERKCCDGNRLRAEC